jgi:hypothetical protein
MGEKNDADTGRRAGERSMRCVGELVGERIAGLVGDGTGELVVERNSGLIETRSIKRVGTFPGAHFGDSNDSNGYWPSRRSSWNMFMVLKMRQKK